MSLDDFKQIYAAAEIKPSVVQNRFYKQTGYDALLRRFCNDHGIIYQAFWTLTANPSIVKSKEVVLLGQQAGISPAQAFYCLLLGLDNLIVLNGTTNEEHMKNDWAAVAQMEAWVQKHPHQWESSLKAFQATIGD